MTSSNPYKTLAIALDALPNGFPATQSGVELRILAALFSPEEAELASALTAQPETAVQIAECTGREERETADLLKGMARRGLINCWKVDKALVFSLMPFVVGFYENQMPTLTAEFAALFEQYYHEAMGPMLAVEPQLHRVIPVNDSVRVDLEIAPYMSVTAIVDRAKAWGVQDCICRKEKALLGQACKHPIDICMVFAPVEGAFNNVPEIRALTHDESLATLKRAAEAGLVHTLSNRRDGFSYICNCCTCSCGILRGISELGIANAVARSPYVNTVDEAKCNACENCVSACHFDAITLELVAHVNTVRCVGCGVCVLNCPEEALVLVRRPDEEVRPVPETMVDWGKQRLEMRGL